MQYNVTFTPIDCPDRFLQGPKFGGSDRASLRRGVDRSMHSAEWTGGLFQNCRSRNLPVYGSFRSAVKRLLQQARQSGASQR
jgi:hypothetical protein